MAKKATKKTSKKTTKKTGKETEAVKAAKPVALKVIAGSPDLVIDCGFMDLLSPLTTEEYKALEESICRDGVRDPLIVWEDEDGTYTLIDGYNRYEICVKHKIKYRICIKSFASRDEVKQWIWDNQESRRNMSPFRRVEATLQLKDIIAKQAKEEQDKARKRKGKHKDRGLACPKLDRPKDEQVHTYQILAKRAGVSKNTYRNAEAVVKQIRKGKVSEKDLDELRSGKKKINSIYLKYCVNKTATQKASQDLSGRIESTFSTLEKQFSHVDRTDLYNQIIEWANAQKAGIERIRRWSGVLYFRSILHA